MGTSEIEAKVAEAICARLGIPCDGLNRERATADARVYIAAYREHAQHVPPVDREALAGNAALVERCCAAMRSDHSELVSLGEVGATERTRRDVLRVLAAVDAHLRAQPAAVPASEPAVLQLSGEPTITSPVTGLEVVVPPGETRTHEARDGSVYTFTRASEPATLRTGLAKLAKRAQQKQGEARTEEARASWRGYGVALGDVDQLLSDAEEASADEAVPASEPAPAASDPEDVDVRTVARVAERAGMTVSFEAAPAASEPAAVTDAMVDAALETWSSAASLRTEPVFRQHVTAGLRAALAAAPQRVREVGADEAYAVALHFAMAGSAAVTPAGLDAMARECLPVLRAAGLCVAVPDTEWAALVAERDGLRGQLSSAEAASDQYAKAIGQIESVLGYAGARPVGDTVADVREMAGAFARATKRAEEAGQLAADRMDRIRESGCKHAAAIARAEADEARVRELEARPAVVDAGALARVVDSVLECVNWANNHARYDDGDASRTAIREELKFARGRLATLLPRAALNGEG